MRTLSRSDAARVRAAVAGAVVSLVVMLILAVQNTRAIGVHFLAWSWSGTPLFAVIVVSLLVGFLLGIVFVLAQPRRAVPRATSSSRRRKLRGRAADRVADPPVPADPVAGRWTGP